MESIPIIQFTSFSEGIVAYSSYLCAYSRDQFGLARLWIAFSKEEGLFSGRTVVGVLPQGFRPSNAIHTEGSAWQVGINGVYLIDVFISIDGEIVFYFNAQPNKCNIGSVNVCFPVHSYSI